MKLVTGLCFAALGLYCAYGFVSTFEPMEGAMMWRLGYGAAVVVCAWRAFSLLRPR